MALCQAGTMKALAVATYNHLLFEEIANSFVPKFLKRQPLLDYLNYFSVPCCQRVSLGFVDFNPYYRVG